MTVWPRVQARRVLRVVNGGTPTGDPDNWGGDVRWATPVDLGQVNGGVLLSTGRTITQQGLDRGSRSVPASSLIISTRAPIGYVAETQGEMAFNQGCRGLVLTTPGDIRFFRYQLSVMAERLNALGQGSTFVELSSEGLAAVPVVTPPPPDQVAIADFLDAETGRIDALIVKKRRLVDVLVELRWSCFESALSRHGVVVPDTVDPASLRDAPLPRDWVAVKLSSILRQLTNGYVGPTRDILRDEGVRYIQGLHIKRGVIDFERRPYFVEEAWHDVHPRTALRSGDVLIVQTGDIGQVAVVPEGFGTANCHALLIGRANRDVVSGLYLGAYLQSRFGYHSLVRVATGALHPHLEFSIRDVPVLVPPMHVQDDLVREVSERQSKIDQVVGLLTRQTDLLAERRQTLITTAVNGEFDVARHFAKAAS